MEAYSAHDPFVRALLRSPRLGVEDRVPQQDVSVNVSRFEPRALPQETPIVLPERSTRMRWGDSGWEPGARAALTSLLGRFGETLVNHESGLIADVRSRSTSEARRTMTNFVPRSLPLSRWEPISTFVQDTVAITVPLTSYSASRMSMVVTMYVDWCFNQQGLPLNAKLLFRVEAIEHFVRHAPTNLGEGTLRNYRSMLLRVSEILLPEHNPVPLKPLNARSSVPPYSSEEIARLRLWARGQNTDLKERKAMLMLALCAGAGLRAIEVAELRRQDIVRDSEGTLVNVGGTKPRSVPMLAEWEPFAQFAIRALDPRALVFVEQSRISHRNTLSRFAEHTSGTIKPRSDRLRATWIVCHLQAGTPMKALMAAAGVEKFENLARYLKYIPELNTAEYRASLRNPSK